MKDFTMQNNSAQAPVGYEEFVGGPDSIALFQFDTQTCPNLLKSIHETRSWVLGADTSIDA